MGTLLIEHWLAGVERSSTIRVLDEASVAVARDAVRERGKPRLPELAVEKLVGAVSELAHNQLAHAKFGELAIVEIERDGVPGLEVIAVDRGLGIANPAAALQGAPNPSGSLGIGLSAVVRQVDELDLDIRSQAGSCVRVRSFAGPVRRSEVGILARAHPAEQVIGDHAVFVRDGRGLVVGVVDGLGHGPLAREASDRAVARLLERPGLDPTEQLQAIHGALAGTRGAVMSLVRIDRAIEHAGVGNIATRVVASDGTAHPLTPTAGTLGSVLPRRIHVDHYPRRADDLVVMFSDGLIGRLELVSEPAVTRRHPIAIAQHLMERFVRGNDDAIIAVVR